MKVYFIAALMLCVSSAATSAQPRHDLSVEESIEALFHPENTLLDVKLAVDQMVEPTVDAPALKSVVNHMADEIATMAGNAGGGAAKLAALRRYLYESGPWNDNYPFQYDLDDPLGEQPENRLLQRYVTTRRGNCITMPMLFLALGQRLGLTMTLAEAPLHVFIKYTDDAGKVWNLEATSGGGFTRDVWYRQKLPMSDEAVASGIYLRALAHAEASALITSFLVEDRMTKGEFEEAIEISDILLSRYPDFAYGLVKKGSAYGGLLRRELAGKYGRVEDIPVELKVKADHWYAQNMDAFLKAEALGWRPQDGQAN